MATTSSTQESVPRYAVSVRSGRAKNTAPPASQTILASSTVRYARLASPSPIEYRGNTMDGIPQITIRQFQRVTMMAYIKTVDDTAITQATTQSVLNSVYRPSVEGGDPVSEFFSTVADVIFDTVQYDAKNPDGYNFKVEFELSTDTSSQGGSTYQLESIIELTSGEHIPIIGRVVVQPVLTSPINAY